MPGKLIFEAHTGFFHGSAGQPLRWQAGPPQSDLASLELLDCDRSDQDHQVHQGRCGLDVERFPCALSDFRARHGDADEEPCGTDKAAASSQGRFMVRQRPSARLSSATTQPASRGVAKSPQGRLFVRQRPAARLAGTTAKPACRGVAKQPAAPVVQTHISQKRVP